jgi:chorismate lyase/3-hydroxybenzoate synthase
MNLPLFNSASFRGEFVPRGSALPDNLLARVDFGLGLQRGDDPRRVGVGIASLAAPHWSEQWVSTLPVQHGWDERFGYSHNGEVLFGSIYLPEAELLDMNAAMLRTYSGLEQLLQRRGYPHCLRIWNFISGINVGDGDDERYRQFSIGRARALALKPDFEKQLPAATAIGMAEPGVVIYFLAGKAPGTPVENPRQVSAYQYPRQYGPQSPSFARATLIGNGDDAQLLVSGTASVVGHATAHPDDPLRQLDETLTNLDSVVGHALQRHFADTPEAIAQIESIKLYLRDPRHLDLLRPQLQRLRGPYHAPLMCLHGEICRNDLVLEAEAVFRISDRA